MQTQASILAETMLQSFYPILTLFLENCIDSLANSSIAIGETDMAKINRTFTLNGQKHWIRANSEQEYAEKLLELLGNKQSEKPPTHKHNFEEYALNWFETFSKPNVSTATAHTYERQINNYLLPAFENMAVEDITTADVQAMFNNMSGAKSSKDKVKMVLNMIFETALEDELIAKNPLKSKRLKISGNASKATETYTVEQMRFLVENISKVKLSEDRTYLALQALHPMRLEEVLGLKWEDVDIKNHILHIRRAVTHPTRNQPEIKETKTTASIRDIGLSKIAAQYLTSGNPKEFVLGGQKPLSYTQVRRICNRIKKDIDFEENITPIRFRTTVLTDIYEQTKDIKQAQAAAGHTTSAMTLKHYVKGRGTATTTATAIDSVYGGIAL